MNHCCFDSIVYAGENHFHPKALDPLWSFSHVLFLLGYQTVPIDSGRLIAAMSESHL